MTKFQCKTACRWIAEWFKSGEGLFSGELDLINTRAALQPHMLLILQKEPDRFHKCAVSASRFRIISNIVLWLLCYWEEHLTWALKKMFLILTCLKCNRTMQCTHEEQLYNKKTKLLRVRVCLYKCFYKCWKGKMIPVYTKLRKWQKAVLWMPDQKLVIFIK